MNLFQAILCGIFYYLSSGPWVVGIGFYTFGRPLVLGLAVGLTLGDPVMGTIVGATIQLIYLGLMSTGGSTPPDAALAGVLGVAAALTTGLSPAEAVAVAVPVGLAGTVISNLQKIIAVYFTHMADKFAAQGRTNMIFWVNVGFPQIMTALLRVIPCTLACYFGVNAISGAVAALSGSVILSTLGVIGGMLPVIGIAMNMKAIFKGDARLFFFVGFLMVVYLNLDLVAISALALIFAVLYIKLKEGKKEAA